MKAYSEYLKLKALDAVESRMARRSLTAAGSVQSEEMLLAASFYSVDSGSLNELTTAQ